MAQSHEVTHRVYTATRRFPKEELYGVTSQVRRSATSIPTNVAEGCGRSGEAELARYLNIAMGSASELEYQLLLARGLKLLGADEHQALSGDVIEVKRMLTSLVQKLIADS